MKLGLFLDYFESAMSLLSIFGQTEIRMKLGRISLEVKALMIITCAGRLAPSRWFSRSSWLDYRVICKRNSQVNVHFTFCNSHMTSIRATIIPHIDKFWDGMLDSEFVDIWNIRGTDRNQMWISEGEVYVSFIVPLACHTIVQSEWPVWPGLSGS